MRGLYGRTAGIRHHAVVTLVILHIEVVSASFDVASVRQDPFQCTVFVDHISTVIRLFAATAPLLHRLQLRPVGRIHVCVGRRARRIGYRQCYRQI